MVFKNPIGILVTGVFYCLTLLSFSLSSPVKASPFLTADQNPFSLVNGLPLPVTAALPEKDSYTYSFSFEITNTLNSDSNISENLILDYESYQLKTNFTLGLGEEWAFKASLPLIHRGGGTFDSAIDNWHDFFGLPRANRPNVANSQYRIRYIKNGITQIDLTQPSNQLGDIQLSLGKQLSSSADSSSSIWSTIELPTGNDSNLTGNKGIDLSIYLATDHRINTDWNLFSNIGLLLPGKSVDASLETETNVWFAYLGLSWSVLTEIDLQIQLNGHTGFYEDSDLRLLGSTYEFIFGGSIHMDSCSDIDIAFSEDIKVGGAPDISLMVSWRSKLGC